MNHDGWEGDMRIGEMTSDLCWRLVVLMAVAMLMSAGCSSDSSDGCTTDDDCPSGHYCEQAAGAGSEGACQATVGAHNVGDTRPDGSEDSGAPDADASGSEAPDVIDVIDAPVEDVCVPLTDVDICARDGKTCDFYSVDDGCGSEVTAHCGTCLSFQRCGNITANVCSCPCEIDGDCYGDGNRNPADDCQVCRPDVSNDEWSMRPRCSTGSVSAGDDHTCATETSGRIFCWGDDTHGQASPPDPAYFGVSSAAAHTCAIERSLITKRLVCWGDDSYGQASPPGGLYRTVDTGKTHSCAIDDVFDDRILCWGRDHHGQASPPDGSFARVSAGGDHTCAIRHAGGEIVCWGDDRLGQASPPAGDFERVSAGTSHTCAIDTSGRIECWGDDEFTEGAPESGSFVAISAGELQTCAIDDAGALHCWGDDSHGQLAAPSGVFDKVSSGRGHVCAIDVSNEVHCWGKDNHGQASP